VAEPLLDHNQGASVMLLLNRPQGELSAKLRGSMNEKLRARLPRSPARGGRTYVVMAGAAAFFGTRGLGWLAHSEAVRFRVA
jgi:hypothetical protein